MTEEEIDFDLIVPTEHTRLKARIWEYVKDKTRERRAVNLRIMTRAMGADMDDVARALHELTREQKLTEVFPKKTLEIYYRARGNFASDKSK